LAFIAATGAMAVGNLYRDAPVPVLAERVPATRVRVVEVALSDATHRVLIDAPCAEIRRRYAEQVRPAAASMLDGGMRIPGADCAGCKIKASCDALPRIPGLLGLADRGTHHRIWSVSTGRTYQICPAQAHLREQHLPAGADSDAVRRGVAVHEWLAAAHDRPGHPPCSTDDLPEPGSGERGIATPIMTGAEYHEVYPFLVQHVAVCPLANPAGVTEVSVEQTVVAFDTTADVTVIAKPDLVYRAGGTLVYREVKTSLSPRLSPPAMS